MAERSAAIVRSPGPTARTSPPAPSGSCSTRPAARTRAGPARRATAAVAAAVAREIPVILAGGLDPANVGAALLAVPAVGVDVGVRASSAPRRRPASGPRKDPLRVALFAKRARAARFDRPTRRPPGPSAVDAGLLDADAAGRWGLDRDVRRPLRARDARRRAARARGGLRRAARTTRVFWAELRALARDVRRPADARSTAPTGSPADVLRARPGAATRRPACRPGSALYLKREDLAHTGAHKINNALGQALLTRRLGKTPRDRRDRRRPARRRDGHRLRPARPALRRLHGRRGHPTARRPNVLRMRRSAPRCAR